MPRLSLLPLFTEVRGKVFCELPLYGVLRSTQGTGPMPMMPTDASWALLEQALRTEAPGTAGKSSP